MWCGDWSQLPQECLRFLSSSSPSEPFLEEARSLLYTLGNAEDGNSHLVRIACLGPFLFGCTFFSKDCEIWARSAGLYYSRAQLVDSTNAEIREAILVLDTFAYHVSFVLVVCSEHGEGPCTGPRLSEKYKLFLEDFDRETIYTNVKTLVESSDIFKLFRKKLTISVLREDQIQCCFMIALKASIALRNGFLDTMLMYIKRDCEKNSEGTHADELKKAGNIKFKEKAYEEACEYYTKAIAEMRFNHLLYSNRAVSALHLQKYRDVEMDARRVIILNPNFEKGYFKVAQVFESQKQNSRAKRVIEYYTKRMNLLALEVGREILDLHKKLTDAGEKSKNGKPDVKTSDEVPAKNKLKTAIPDLLSDSDSEEVAATPAECTSAPPEPALVTRAQTMDALKKSCEDLLAGLFSVALQGFKTVLSSEPGLSELNLVLVEYAAGCALLGMGSLSDLKHSVEYFLGIIQNHKDIVFPLAYYGVSRALIKMNRFSEALPHIEKCMSILDKGIHFTETLLWPETKTKVDCAGRSQLQKAMEEMQALCRAPPKWDAMCCLETCQLHRSIYYSDPDFRGFQQLHCASKCLVQYHPSCWREYREARNLTEKAFLGEVCPTPDCCDVIIKVETIEKDGTMGKQFVLPERMADAAAKQKKTKKEKKLEQREQKKKQRRAAEPPAAKQPSAERDEDGNSVASGGCESSPASAAVEEASAERAKPPKPRATVAAAANARPADAKSEVPATPAAGATCEEVPKYDAPYVLKKDENAEDELVADGRSKKWKKKRNRPVRVVELDSGDFLYKEYQERIEKLAQIKIAVEEEHGDWRSFCQRQKSKHPELDPNIPFYIPENLRNNEAALEAVLQHRMGNNDAASADVAETIYQLFEQLIQSKGPLHINDELVKAEVAAFPKESREAILQAGGLHSFLMRSLRFTFDNDIIYMASMRPRGPSLYTPDDFSIPDEDSDYQEDDEEEYEDEENEEGFQAEAQETGPSQFVETLCHPSAAEAANQAGELAHNHKDATTPALPAARPPVTTNLNPNAKAFELALETQAAAPSLPPVAAEPPAASSSATEGPPPKPVVPRSAAGGRDVVAQRLLVVLPPAQLADSLVVGVNAFDGPLEPEMLARVNRGLKHCKLRNRVWLQEVGIQVEEANGAAEERDSLAVQCEELSCENARLKEKLESALDNAAQLQSKHSVENRHNKDRLEEVQTELQNERENFKKTKIEMESELKKLQGERLKLKEEIKTLKSNRNENVKDTLDRTITEFTRVKSENEELEETCRTLQEAADIALERAKLAEVRILETAKEWGLERFERSRKQVQKILQEIDSERRTCMGTAYALDLERRKNIAEQYIKEWAKSYEEFVSQVQQHITKVESGQALIDLPVLDLPTKPDLELPAPVPRPPLLPLPPEPGVLGARAPFYAPPAPRLPTPPSSLGSKPRPFGSLTPPLLACPPGVFLPPGLSNGVPSMAEAPALAKPPGITAGPPPGLGQLGGAASFGPFGQGDSPAAPHAVGRHEKARPEATEAPTQKSDKSEKLMLKLLEKYPGCTRDDIKAALQKVHKEIGLKGLTVAEIIKATSDVLDETFPQGAGGGGEGGAAAAPGSKQPRTRPILKALRPSQSAVSELEKPPGLRPQAQKTWASREAPVSFNGVLHNCSICLEELTGSQKEMKTSCGHSFHEKCLQQWFTKDRTCPICRAHSISDKDFPTLG
ncbi:uncharacterized protein LOC144178592 isoform X2 [Haemaphysalis longicornis]